MLHISDLSAAIGNPAKSFMWNVVIPALPDTSGIRAQTAQIPGVSSTDMELWHQGQRALFPGSEEYDHVWTCAIAESEAGDVLDAIWEWRQLIFNQYDGTQSNVNIFKRDVVVEMLTSNGTVWSQYVLRQAYPKTVEPIDLDKAANTEALRWTITFNYDWWDRG